MGNANGKHAGAPDNGGDVTGSENRIVVPLTVLFAHVQLLRRRLERGSDIGSEDLHKAVEQMDTATRAIVAEMQELEILTSRVGLSAALERIEESVAGPVRGDPEKMTLESNKDEGARATPDQMGRKHVFVVNGSPEFLDIVRQLQQDENYNVTTTNFVPLSFDTIEAAQPSLLIVDLVIGEQAGWDLLGQLRRAVSTKDIPVLLVSTRPALLQEAKDRHEEFGGDSYLTKPFDLDDLLDNIAQLIGKA